MITSYAILHNQICVTIFFVKISVKLNKKKANKQTDKLVYRFDDTIVRTNTHYCEYIVYTLAGTLFMCFIYTVLTFVVVVVIILLQIVSNSFWFVTIGDRLLGQRLLKNMMICYKNTYWWVHRLAKYLKNYCEHHWINSNDHGTYFSSKCPFCRS